MTWHGGTLLRVVLLLTAWIVVAAGQTTPKLTPEVYTRDWARWAGRAPDRLRWAPDGKTLYFEWAEPGSAAATYTVSLSGGTPRPVAPEDQISVPPGGSRGELGVWNRRRDRLGFEWQGDIVLLSAGRDVQRLTNTEAAEQNPKFTFRDDRVTYEVNGNLFAVSLDAGATVQLTNFRAGRDTKPSPQAQQITFLEAQQRELFDTIREQETQARATVAQTRRVRAPRPGPTTLKEGQQARELQLSPDERFVTFTLVDDSRFDPALTILRPTFITKTGYVEAEPLASAVKPGDAVRTYRLGVVDLARGETKYFDTAAFGKPVNWNPVIWSGDGQRAVAWVGSQDHKDLWLCRLDVASATATVIYHERDDAHLRGFRAGRILGEEGFASGFLSDDHSLYFLSERDGYYHLYAVSDTGGAPRQLTSGPFEVTQPRLSREGTTWYFLSNEGDPGQLQLYSMPQQGGARTRLTSQVGWHNYALSPDESMIALTYENPQAPAELFLMPNRAGATPTQITRSMTQEFRAFAWQQPEYVTFTDKSGWLVHAELFKPLRPHPQRPAILHVHGSGWTQGVAKRFASYFPENRAEFQYYAEHGYTVLNVDYKGSRGYGRDSRTAVHLRMGTPEVDSLVAAVDYLVAAHGVNRQRVGLYGHSYGGYLVLMALFDRPGVFAGGVAQAPPSDNAHGQATNFVTRLIGVPWEQPDVYRRTSPIYLAEHFTDRLLILHGMMDAAVAFQESVRLTQRLIELNKTGWDMALYPIESHVPRSDSSRLDMERRRFAFFEEVLKGPRAAGASVPGK